MPDLFHFGGFFNSCLQLYPYSSLISLQVKDQEFPFNRDLARILVAVEDSNDNIPYFTSTVYDAVAYESSPVGTSVLQVTALDKDNGINGQLTYTMEAGVDLIFKGYLIGIQMYLFAFPSYVFCNLFHCFQETPVVCLESITPQALSSLPGIWTSPLWALTPSLCASQTVDFLH